MKRILFTILPFFILILGFTISLFLRKSRKIEEEVYSVATQYSYITEESVQMEIDLFDTHEDSLLQYGDKSQAYLHSWEEDYKAPVWVKSVKKDGTVFYQQKQMTIYHLILEVRSNSFSIEECYLSLEFSNKIYTVFLGSIAISPIEDIESFTPTNLSGLSFETPYLSLGAIVISIYNSSDYDWILTNVSGCENFSFGFGEEYIIPKIDACSVDSYILYDYHMEVHQKELLIKAKQEITFLVPIKYFDEGVLTNTYLYLTINGKDYYIPNFVYLRSNDLDAMEKCVKRGVIRGM